MTAHSLGSLTNVARITSPTHIGLQFVKSLIETVEAINKAAQIIIINSHMEIIYIIKQLCLIWE